MARSKTRNPFKRTNGTRTKRAKSLTIRIKKARIAKQDRWV